MWKLKTRSNPSGYREFIDKDGTPRLTHRRAMENKLGGEIEPGKHVHHIDGDKTNNRHNNLADVFPEVHRRLHHKDSEACFRCGRSGHWASDCFASTTVSGRELDDDEDDGEWDEDDDDDDEWDEDDDDDDDDDEWDDDDDDDDW